MPNQVFENLKIMLQVPDLASKRWIYEQYDSQVMNDTVQTGQDASIVRVRGTQKALAISCDCTPRYVEADPFEGAKQAVAETYRNISAVGATPLAITNCLNFGNPQKPEIMGQIVRAIKGINEACIALDYPVVSGNVSLYNETDGNAIKPTPAIGGVGLLKNLEQRCDQKFKMLGDEIFVVGKTTGHTSCSLFEREILKIDNKKNPPITDLAEEKKNGKFVRDLIEIGIVNTCHDVSDGGLMISLFEMSDAYLGCEIDISEIGIDDPNVALFCEDQSRYIIVFNPALLPDVLEKAKSESVTIQRIGNVIRDKISFEGVKIEVEELVKLNEAVFDKKFS